MGNPWLTTRFVDYVLSDLIDNSSAATKYPPELPSMDDAALGRFKPLDAFGEYSTEFILTVEGLLAVAEKTNYPAGHLHADLWRAFRDGEEIYKVLGIATMSRRGV